VPAREVFAAVAREVGLLLGAGRYEPGDELTIVAHRSSSCTRSWR
jgi:hypothetical protein